MRFFKTIGKKVLAFGLAFSVFSTLLPMDALGAETTSVGLVDQIGEDTFVYGEADLKSLAGSLKGKTDGKYVIVLDPGHDLSHPGAIYNGAEESVLNLKIALACYEVLDAHPDITVYMTRDEYGNCPYPETGRTDSVELGKRVEFAASKNADLFVSLHLNASGAHTARGTEVYYQNINYNYVLSLTGKAISDAIAASLEKLGLTNRGPRVRNATSTTYDDGSLADYYAVVRRSKLNGFTGFIVEHCFMDNAEDFTQYLSTDEKLAELGRADAQAIIESLPLLDNAGLGAYKDTFDPDYYWDNNTQVQKEFAKTDTKGLFLHWLSYGINDGLLSHPNFNIKYYFCNNSQLWESLGDYKQNYIRHYIETGKGKGLVADKMLYPDREWRFFYTENPNKDAPTVWNGVDYSAVYDYSYYMNKYPTIKAACGDNKQQALEHFVTFGMKEKRIASPYFDVNSYYNKYPDLRNAYGKDWEKYYLHYIYYGKAANRVATGVDKLEGATTVFDGVDYSLVYDFNYYLEKYPQLREPCQNDEKIVLQHFVTFGMDEGRVAKSTFDVKSYYMANADVRRAYGTKWRKLFLHYMAFGHKENRPAYGVDTFVGATTVYEGVDYSSVYNYNYYTKAYPDVFAAYGYDDQNTLLHFIVFGMAGGRQGSEEFNWMTYKENYADLAASYGDTKTNYYKHYLAFGKKEGRIANAKIEIKKEEEKKEESQYYAIMGESDVTVRKMADFYTNTMKYTYPDSYRYSDAPTIEDFCNIYLEESKAEGIKAEVAFCQAMLETRFLQFGGDVDVDQYNFCGLGATGGGEKGYSFDTVRLGIRAHVQHLKAYASTEGLQNQVVDPRYTLVSKGSAPYVEYLGKQENPTGTGWATSAGYGNNIINHIKNLMK